MVQRTVLKIDLSCSKCKKKLLRAVSTIEGVDKVEADVAKGTLTVTGNADPYKVIVNARKATGKSADVVSVGPPPAPPKPAAEAQKKGGGGGESNNNNNNKGKDEKKKDKGKDEEHIRNFHDPNTCPECRRVALVPYDQPWTYSNPTPSSCSLM